MLKRASVLLVLSLAVCLPAVGTGEPQAAHHPAAAAGSEIRLSPPLQQALVHEMLAIQNAMMDLIPGIAAGDWSRVAKLAAEIEGSLLLKQQLSAEQMEELHHALPAGFIELDQSFHRLAGMLAHVAQQGHVELVSFYFYKLSEGCVGCHSKYAQHRFPAFSASRGSQHTH